MIPDAVRRVLVLVLTLAPLGAAEEGRAGVVALAAASLAGSLDELAGNGEARRGGAVTISCAGGSALARQLQQDAPAEVVVSASAEWMDALEAEGLIRPDPRRDLHGNRLVLAGSLEAEPVGTGPDLDLAGLLGDGRLALALVAAAPAGIDGREALTALGLWDDVEPRVAQADDERRALALVARGEAPMGVVHATDALAGPGVGVLGVFPKETHSPIADPAAPTAEADAEAEDVLGHLASPEAGVLFGRHGLTLP